jgi:hypothetical protein
LIVVEDGKPTRLPAGDHRFHPVNNLRFWDGPVVTDHHPAGGGRRIIRGTDPFS